MPASGDPGDQRPFADRLDHERDSDVVKIDWVDDPWTHGAFQLPQPGQEPMLHDGYFQFQTVLDRAADRGVYLAGDSVSWYGGWIEGALQRASMRLARPPGARAGL